MLHNVFGLAPRSQIAWKIGHVSVLLLQCFSGENLVKVEAKLESFP